MCRHRSTFRPNDSQGLIGLSLIGAQPRQPDARNPLAGFGDLVCHPQRFFQVGTGGVQPALRMIDPASQSQGARAHGGVLGRVRQRVLHERAGLWEIPLVVCRPARDLQVGGSETLIIPSGPWPDVCDASLRVGDGPRVVRPRHAHPVEFTSGVRRRGSDGDLAAICPGGARGHLRAANSSSLSA